MKKVLALVGSGRKGHTYKATREFLARLEALGGVETELVMLSDYRLGLCRGCKLCFSKGEEHCPLDDDRDMLFAKMDAADGVVLASPNYSFQVSGLMKAFLDRLGFLMHRPRFHGRAFTSIVVQGISGGGKIRKYLDFVGFALGFTVAKGSYSTAFEPMTPKEQAKRDERLEAQARRFHKVLAKAGGAPSLLELAVFRFARTSVSSELDETSADWRYYRDKGWFESDYFTDAPLGFGKRAAGDLLDSIFRFTSKARY